MMRWDLIDRLLPKERGAYLEIGIEDGQTGAMVKRGDRTTTKHGVDPVLLPMTRRYYHERFEMSSDAFFAEVRPCSRAAYDVIFIDGCHEAGQVLRDIHHSLGRLKEGGAIVVHDCNPTSEYLQRVPRPNVRGRWNGDGWKAIAHLRSHEYSGLEVFVIDADEGLGIIRANEAFVEDAVVWDRWFQHWSYDTLEADRAIVLGLVSASDGLARLCLEPIPVPAHRRDPRVAMYADPIAKLACREAGMAPPPPPPTTPSPATTKPKAVAVVTALFGDYDVLRDPTVVDPEADYVCVTDRPRPSKVWRMLVVDKGPVSDVRASRHVKTMIHEYVPEAEITLYIDASFELRALPVALIGQLGVADALVYKHSERNNIFTEAKECIRLGRDDPAIIEQQMKRYLAEGYLSLWLSANGILVRRMSGPMNALGQAWWTEIERGSHRDQLSFPYVCDQLGCTVKRLTGSIYQGPYAKHHKHKRGPARSGKELVTIEEGLRRTENDQGRKTPVAATTRPKDVLEALREGRIKDRGPDITTHVAYDERMDLGGAYNEILDSLPTDDCWAVLLDHDAMWTTSAWYHQIRAAIEAQPDAGLFTAVTNRVGNKAQRTPGVIVDNHDMRYHRKKGKELFERHYAELVDVTDLEPPISGVVMIMKKATWKAVGGFERGFLGVDNRMHVVLRQAGHRIYMLKGLYVYHWYRAEGDKAHLSLLGAADRVPHAPNDPAPEETT